MFLQWARFSHFSVRRKRWVIVVLSACFSTAFILWLTVLQAQNSRADDAVYHSRQVLAAGRLLLWELVNAETGMRGYIISGNPDFLQPYNTTVQDAPKTLQQLETLCADDLQMSETLNQLRHAVTDILQYHALNRQRVEEGRFHEAREATQQGEGKRRMDRVRVLAQAIIDRQEAKDLIGQAELLRSRSIMSWLLRLGLALSVFLSIAAHNILGDITDRIEALSRNNQLASREKSIGEPVGGHDEIADLDAQFRALWADKDLETRQALEAYAQELERSNRDLQDFASVASHDLQEPLRKIMAFGTRLEQHLAGKLDERATDYLARIRKSAERMSSLNESLLELSRVRSRSRTLEDMDLNMIVEGVLSDLEECIATSGATVTVGALPAITGDSSQMRQLFQNLIANALKFRPKERAPVIEIDARRKRRQWEITVQDNGLGFEQRFAEQIFRPFQRLHGRSEYEGNGIGLTIVEKIVSRHGGTIAVQSEPDRGARFTILLPERKEAPDEQAATTTAALAG